MAVAVVAAAVAACSDRIRPQSCGPIPTDGCPVVGGGTCRDPLCAAIYECVDGGWRLVQPCSGNSLGGGGGHAGGGPAGAGGQGGFGLGGLGGQGACEGGPIDRTDEVTGCTPDLQVPDCAAALAEICHPCLTECLDFFLCTVEGWTLVAYCDEDGGLTVVDR